MRGGRRLRRARVGCVVGVDRVITHTRAGNGTGPRDVARYPKRPIPSGRPTLFSSFARRASEGSARRFAPLGKTGFYHRPGPKSSPDFASKNPAWDNPLQVRGLDCGAKTGRAGADEPGVVRDTGEGACFSGCRMPVRSLFRFLKRSLSRLVPQNGVGGILPPAFFPCGGAAGCGRIAWQHRTLETAGRPAGPAKR